MFHQIITSPEQVAEVMNNIEGDIYQIIPFKRIDIDLFLILWQDHPTTNSTCYGVY